MRREIMEKQRILEINREFLGGLPTREDDLLSMHKEPAYVRELLLFLPRDFARSMKL